MRTMFFLFAFSMLFAACTNNYGDKPATVTATPALSKMDSLSERISAAKDLQDEGKSSEALHIADSILQKYPGQLDALNLKSEILKQSNRPAEALAVLEKAYAMQPHDKETAYNLAYAYAEQRNPKVLPLTDTLLKYDKTETVARAWYIKATYFANTGHTNEALKYYTAANNADYNFIDAYLDKGQLLYEQKKYEEALKSFAIGQKVSPASAEFYYWVGKTQEAMGNKSDAKLNYERAFSLDKNMKEAKEAADKL